MRNGFETSPGFRMALTAVLIVLSLLLLAGCSSPMPTARQTLPPLPMLEPRPIPKWEGRTYRDLLGYSLRLRESAMAAEADKTAARDALDLTNPSQRKREVQ